MFIIDQCIKVYKFIDYLQDRRKLVKLKHINYQPPVCVIEALLYKMKADYLRYIFECISGDQGLLVTQTDPCFFAPEAFDDDVESRVKHEIRREENIGCLICNPKDAPGEDSVDYMAEFYKKKMTLMDYMKHEVFHEFERAKR